MAEMKIDITKAVKDTAERALDEYQYKGHTIREWADKITSREYQPVKRGSWSEKQVAYKDSFGDFHFGFKCSECGAIISKSNYCGNCGAKMDIDTGDYYTPKDGGDGE